MCQPHNRGQEATSLFLTGRENLIISFSALPTYFRVFVWSHAPTVHAAIIVAEEDHHFQTTGFIRRQYAIISSLDWQVGRALLECRVEHYSFIQWKGEERLCPGKAVVKQSCDMAPSAVNCCCTRTLGMWALPWLSVWTVIPKMQIIFHWDNTSHIPGFGQNLSQTMV